MREHPAGDVDYELAGHGYAGVRRPEPVFARRIRHHLGDIATMVNVGAGTGSYEPHDVAVTPVEPSAAMRAQRPTYLAPAIDAVAEDLPFDDGAFDAALAAFTVHQWRDLHGGLRELRRVTRGPVVVMTCDPGRLSEFWLAEYAPEMMDHECGRMPALATVADTLGGRVAIEELPIPTGCVDGFAEAFFGRPEALLDPTVRQSQSAWRFVDPEVESRSVGRLHRALADGSWDEKYGSLRSVPQYRGSLRLVVSEPG